MNKTPLFGCEDCYEDRTFYAEDLAVWQDKLFCEECWEERLFYAEEDAGFPAFEDLNPFVPVHERLIKELTNALDYAIMTAHGWYDNSWGGRLDTPEMAKAEAILKEAKEYL